MTLEEVKQWYDRLLREKPEPGRQAEIHAELVSGLKGDIERMEQRRALKPDTNSK